MKVLMLSDHYPLSPRVIKVRNSILKEFPHSEVDVFAWNRNNIEVDRNQDYITTHNQSIGYGNILKKIKNIVGYVKSVKKYNQKYKATHIHVIDFSLLIFSNLIGKSSIKIYEVYDIKYQKNKFINLVREKVEIYFINKYIDKIIYASPYFEEYYLKKGLKKTIPGVILNNKPNNSLYEISKENNEINDNNVINIGFIGTIRHTELLKNLLQASKDFNNIKVLLAGDGPSVPELLDFITKNNLEKKVNIIGRFQAEELPILYKECDYIWAAYPNKNMNVRYAVSNKFFESKIFKKKIIVANSTKIADLVTEDEIGFSVNPYSVKDIEKLLNTLTKDFPYIYPLENSNDFYWEDEEVRLREVY